MGYRTVYGNAYSENGWRMVDANHLDNSPVPGTDIRIPFHRGIPNTILKAFAADFHEFVESLYNARGGSDEGGWTLTNSVGSSNHLSGTAMDLNWSDHPFRVSYAGFTQAEIAVVRELLAFYEGMVFWGQDWNSPKDAMHFQMGYNTANNIPKCQDFIKRKIRPDGRSTFRRGMGEVDPNAFPLPAGYYYGPLEGPEQSISGQYEGTPQHWRDGLGRWQAKLGLPVTKVWDAATQNAATTLQLEKGWPPLKVDLGNGEVELRGCVFKGEWDAVFHEGWRLPHKKEPVRVGPHEDQLVMRWNCLGGQTPVEALAEIRDHLLDTEDRGKTGVVMA